MTLHGHTRIELTDVHTGAVEVVEVVGGGGGGGGGLVAGGAELRLGRREERGRLGVGRVDGVAGEGVHGVVDAVGAWR